MKRLALLAAAAAVYLVAAWMVAPGFYDGFAPQQPYNWTSPPPQAPPGNRQPLSGHAVINVISGVSDAGSAFTDDGQLVIGFLPGAFDVSGSGTPVTSVTVDIKPEATFPTPTGLHFATNVYLVTASAPLSKGPPSSTCSVATPCIVLRYSDVVPAPSFIYFAVDANSPWKSIGASAASQTFTIQTTTSQLGYFAAGYPSNSVRSPTGTSQLLPIAVAVLILGVVIAGIPLAMVRRRRAAGEVAEPDEENEDQA